MTDGSSFGGDLRRERELREVSLPEISEATKISMKFLHAIEENQFDLLPGGVFNVGFIRAYAKHIGVDDDEMVNNYLFHMQQLQAVRSGRWKLYLPLGGKTRTSPARLYDLEADLCETMNLAGKRPLVVTRLLSLAEKAREDLGDIGRPGSNQRPAGFVADPTARRLRQ